MRRAKLNATDILTALNEESEIDDFSGDDSDFDTTWQPFQKKTAGQSDLSGSDSDEDQDTSTNNEGNNINNLDVRLNTNNIEVPTQTSTQSTSNIGWSQVPFRGVPLPEFNGP